MLDLTIIRFIHWRGNEQRACSLPPSQLQQHPAAVLDNDQRRSCVSSSGGGKNTVGALGGASFAGNALVGTDLQPPPTTTPPPPQQQVRRLRRSRGPVQAPPRQDTLCGWWWAIIPKNAHPDPSGSSSTRVVLVRPD